MAAILNIIPYPKEVKRLHGTVPAPYILRKESGATMSDEEYYLKVSREEILLVAGGDAGFFYGEKTFLQMRKQFPSEMPAVEIKDKPKHEYRSYMLDCARHFFTVAEIKKQIDIMAILKLNRFHWHLTDDQGWRIESKRFPLLTEIGSRRKETGGDGKPVSGYYTQEEISDIVSYCKERFIEVVPEIDLPGHSGAAFASYPELSCRNEKIDVSTTFGISPYVVCAGKDGTYEFFYELLDEVMGLFPGKYIHIGGDEALKANWLKCEDCQAKIKELGLENEEELQGYFLNKLIERVNGRKKTAILWNDALAGGNIMGDFVVQYWKESRECVNYAVREAARGRKIIWSPFFSAYLDYPYGMTSLRKSYQTQINAKLAKAVIGLEAPLWAEYVKDVKQLEKMTYPRLLAIAEKAWNPKDYKSFTARLKAFKPMLDEYKINYEGDPDPMFFKGKIAVVRFFINAYKHMSKVHMRLMRTTNKEIKQKYSK